ncbi:MAG: putative toxin-antitoxin system toxin component, PIN family [bacterium]
MGKTIKIVFDTNVIVSFLISRFSKEEIFYKTLKLSKLGSIEIFYSTEVFDELLETIKIPKIRSRLNKNASRFLADYKFLAKKVLLTTKVSVCRDPKDNKFLELAKEIQADYLITGDNDLLDLKKFETTQILKPADFVVLLKV